MISRVKSETVNWASGGKGKFRLEGFLGDTRGPRGGILVIDALLLTATLNLTTGGGVTLAGADHATFVKKFRISDVAGERRVVSGFKARTLMHMDLGIRTPADPATFAAATTADATFQYIFRFTQRNAFRGLDYGLPVHDLLGGSAAFEWEMPANADLHATGGTPTINSGTYVLTAILRELPPGDHQFFVRDVVEEHSQVSNTDLYIWPNGRIVREAWIVKESAGGGTTVTTVTDFTCLPLKEVGIARLALKHSFLQHRDVVIAQDPVYNDKALPVLFGRDDAQIEDFPILGGQLLLKLTSTMTTPDMLVRYIAPKDERQMAIAAARMGVPQGARYRIKTRGKTKQDPREWGPYAAFYPVKADR